MGPPSIYRSIQDRMDCRSAYKSSDIWDKDDRFLDAADAIYQTLSNLGLIRVLSQK